MHTCDSLAVNSQMRLITRANIIVELIGRSCRVRTDEDWNYHSERVHRDYGEKLAVTCPSPSVFSPSSEYAKFPMQLQLRQHGKVTGRQGGRRRGGGRREWGKGSTGTRHQDSTLRRVHFLHAGVHIWSSYKPQCESFAGVVVVVVALRMTSLQIPEHVVLNETVRMQCNFNLDKEQLYSVKWYKDGHEFYRFTPRDRPEVLMFPVRGVNVNVSATCKDT